MLQDKLLERLTDGPERVGFVLKSGEIVEVENVCPKPMDGFDVRGEDLVKYPPLSIATWHTHPGATRNLSVDDYESFVNWPELAHYIIGTDGVRKYVVEKGEVLVG